MSLQVPWSFEGASEGRKEAQALAARIAGASCPVLIMGPTGTGKDVLAEDIHLHSARAAGRFVAVNCAAISTSLFESELFGHARGAYTSAVATKPGLVDLADGGTLFLDEIGELPLESQAKLLRFLAKGTFWPLGSTTERRSDVRVIAATNRDLRAMLDSSFREDLFFRLSVVTILVPPLAPADTRAIARTLTLRLAADHGLHVEPGELQALLDLCSCQAWRGGARELRNALERYLLLRLPHLSVEENWRGRPETQRSAPPAVSALPGESAEMLEHLENLVFLSLAQGTGDVRGIAHRLDRSLQTVYDRLKKLGIKPQDLAEDGSLRPSLEKTRRSLAPYLPWLLTILKGVPET